MKIFLLGLSSTGKHSLMKALEILGYTGVHYPTRFEELDGYDSSCDAFIVRHFKQLDKKYLGSLFVYTDRSDQD